MRIFTVVPDLYTDNRSKVDTYVKQTTQSSGGRYALDNQ